VNQYGRKGGDGEPVTEQRRRAVAMPTAKSATPVVTNREERAEASTERWREDESEDQVDCLLRGEVLKALPANWT